MFVIRGMSCTGVDRSVRRLEPSRWICSSGRERRIVATVRSQYRFFSLPTNGQIRDHGGLDTFQNVSVLVAVHGGHPSVPSVSRGGVQIFTRNVEEETSTQQGDDRNDNHQGQAEEPGLGVKWSPTSVAGAAKPRHHDLYNTLRHYGHDWHRH